MNTKRGSAVASRTADPPSNADTTTTVMPSQEETTQAAIEAVALAYRGEVSKLKMQLVLYRKALLEHGIEPPDAEGDDLLALVNDCNAVISTASVFVQQLGAAKELLYGWPQT